MNLEIGVEAAASSSNPDFYQSRTPEKPDGP